MMFKLMRACIAVTEPEDLWFCPEKKGEGEEQMPIATYIKKENRGTFTLTALKKMISDLGGGAEPEDGELEE